MSTMDNGSAEQLWYTWSDVGLSTVNMGFRIRAASPGLSEIYSERVKSMDRYMRYVLPSGTDRFAITPDMAPICLAFIRTDWNNEYILVHKKYVGEDGVGRLGNFFVHVIALGNLSQYFSAANAILLWGSDDIWKTNDKWKTQDKKQERRDNTLDPIPLNTLQSTSNFQPNYVQVQQYLPFVIEAYLTRKNRSPLYIAASADNVTMIAILIAGVANWLPRQLVAGLTFSTYEPDVTKATTEIVGTSWIPTPGKGPEASQVFSPQFYHEKLAVNCYTGEQSPLQEHPQITHNPLAADFAAYATECLVSDNVEQLYALLELAEKSQALDVDTFLRMYDNEIVNVDSIGEADIDKALADLGLYLDRLSSQNFRKRIIECAAANRQWSTNQLFPRLRVLCNHAQKEYTAALSSGQQYLIDDTSGASISDPTQIGNPSLQRTRQGRNGATTSTKKNQKTLAQALFMLANRAIPDIVKAMKSVGAERQSAQDGTTGTERQKKIETVASLLSLMDCCLLPQNSLKVWRALFDQIIEHPNRNTVAFLTTQWEIFSWLLKKWNSLFPVQPEYDNAIRPLLIIPWSYLGEFLKLNLRQRHGQWNVIAVDKLIQDASLTPQIAQGLAQNYSTEINNLLAQLLQETNFTMATSFATRLIENNYPVKSQFAALIENLLAQLIRVSQLWTYLKSLIVVLANNDYVGTDAYLNLVEAFLDALLTTNPQTGVELIDILVAHRYPRKKNLVDLMLKSRVATLESILPRIYRTDDQLNTFFLQYGSYYLSEPDQMRAMIAIYQKLLPLPQKLERLVVLLDTLRDGTMILPLVTMTPLEAIERVGILERYGKKYLKLYQQTPQLADKVVQWYIQLVNSGYSGKFNLLRALFTSATDYKLLETLLLSTRLSLGESQEFFREYGSLPRYFPFFYQSTTIIALFSRLAQQANTLAASSQPELAMEKMNLLFTWLQPPQSQSPLSYQIVERLLQAASLTPHEQIDFLERYGVVCFSHFPQVSLLKEYVGTYVSELNEDSFERAETQRFITFLAQQLQLLNLDTGTQSRIQCWIIIDSYLISPDATPTRLRALTTALLSIGLPKKFAFTTKLAKVFVSCVRTSDDLSVIISFMQQIRNIQVTQLLYLVAEQVAALYRQSQDASLLIPYLSFVLSNAPELFVPNKEGQKYFRHVFLDTLLSNIKEVDLVAWRQLNSLVQTMLSIDACEKWHDYLKGLQLLDRLQSSEGVEIGITTSSQPQLSPPVAVNDTRYPSWLPRFQLNSDTPDYREAKNALARALRSKEVEFIASAWRQYGAIIDSTHPNHIKPHQREKIDVSCAFAQYYQAVSKTPNGPIDYANKLVELSEAIELLSLKLSQDQIECVDRARTRVQYGGKQPYQNPVIVQPDSLPRQNSSPGAGHGPNPIELNPRSVPRNVTEQQSPTGTKFNIDEDSKHKKKK